MTYFRLIALTFILAVLAFHVLPQIHRGCAKIEQRAREGRP